MFTDCSGTCDDCIINYIGACIAGHGDDDFYPITEETAKDLIKKGKMDNNKIHHLKYKFPSLNKL